MKGKVSLLLIAVLGAASALILSSCTRPTPERRMEALEIGSSAPSFKLPDLKGQQVSLDQYRGKLVMLDFWATWCGPCRMTMPVMEKLQKEYSDRMVLLAINLQEDEEEVRDFVKQQNISSTVLLDRDGMVGQEYGSESIPMHVLIDKSGVVRHIQLGYSDNMASRLRSEIEKLK